MSRLSRQQKVDVAKAKLQLAKKVGVIYGTQPLIFSPVHYPINWIVPGSISRSHAVERRRKMVERIVKRGGCSEK